MIGINMNVQENILLAQSRAESYKLLSQCFFLPDQNLLDTVKGIQPTAGSLWKELVGTVHELDGIDDLEIDYSRLFVGPFKLLAPPYESVYLGNGGQVVDFSTIEIQNLYLDEGIDVNIKEVPDHIAIELEFMYYLINKGISAINDTANEKIQKNLNTQQAFLTEHLCCWISKLCKAVGDNARTDFYKSLSKITDTFVLNDLAFLEQDLDS